MEKGLKCVFEPRSIAVIGASNSETKLGYSVFKNLLEYKGRVFPVNVREERVLGRKAYKSIKEIEDEIDLAVIVVPKQYVLEAIEESGDKGACAAIIITSGFGETGEEGKREELELVKVARAKGMRLIGPNCVGVMNLSNDLNATFIMKAKRGRVAFISQSGALGAGIIYKTLREGIGFSKFVSLGNMADLDFSDLIEYLSEDKDTDSIMLYLEGLKDGRRFLHVTSKASKKKPIIVVKGGMSSSGAAAVSSHTGSLAGSAEVYSAAFKQSGVILARTIDEALSFSRAFSQPLLKGKRIAIATNAGGAGVLLADQLELRGLELAKLSESTVSSLRSFLPPMASLRNPVDMIASARGEDYYKAVKLLLEDENVDGVIVACVVPTFGGMSRKEHAEGVIKAIEDVKSTKPVVALFMAGEVSEEAKGVLEKAGIPSYERPEDAASAMYALYIYSKIKER